MSGLQKTGLWFGPLIALLLILFVDLDPGRPIITYTAALALLMALWWISEAVPLAVTALIPVALFPLFGIMNGKAVASQYFNHVIFLFLGGFLLALAMERWNLHKRIALFILLRFSQKPAFIMLGFMVATAFLSMWISNTATAMMMVPIALSVILSLEERNGRTREVARYSIGLLLGIAYSASIGGIATLVGTPPNLSFARIYSISFPEAAEVGFAPWFFFALPLSIIFLILCWLILLILWGRKVPGSDKTSLREDYRKLGPMTSEERKVLIMFISLALLWLFRADIEMGSFRIPGWGRLFNEPSYINDGVVATFFGILLFVIPAKGGERLMDWDTAKSIPWGIILLFGGGFALASGFMESGLSFWIGGELAGLSSLPDWGIVAAISGSITFLTELTSNTATAEMILPVLAALSTAIDVHPLLLMIPATIASSFAFMMPVATPPNAIIFGTQRIKVIDMVKTGLILNLIGIVLVTISIFLFAGHIIP